MKRIDKVLEDKELVKKTIIEQFCPNFFNLKSNCINNCRECWNRELEESEE